MRDMEKKRVLSVIVAAIVLTGGWAARGDENDRAAPRPVADDDQNNGPDGRGAHDDPLAGPESDRRRSDRDRDRGWDRNPDREWDRAGDRDGEDDDRWRSRRGEGRSDDDRGRRRGWKPDEADEDLPPLTPEQTETLMRQVEEYFPELHQKMVQLQKTRPEEFKVTAERVRHLVRKIDRRRGGADRPDHPFAFFHRMARMAHDYRSTESAERRTEIRSQMRSEMKKHIERRQEDLREEIRRMEERLEEMKARLAEFEANKDGSIDEHLEKILRGEGFGPPPGRGPRDRPSPREGFRRGPYSRPADAPIVPPGPPGRPPPRE